VDSGWSGSRRYGPDSVDQVGDLLFASPVGLDGDPVAPQLGAAGGPAGPDPGQQSFGVGPPAVVAQYLAQVDQAGHGPDSLIAKRGSLSREAVELLRPPPVPHRPGPVRLDDGDRKLLAALAADARAGFEQLAAATGWSPTTVRRRMRELCESGVLYLDLDVDGSLFSLGTRTMLWLSVPPAHLEETGKALAAHPEIAFAAATTGPTNLYASVVCADQRELYRYLTTRVAALPAVTKQG
jgi:DNA-binding Lrp family transcriptional regulator